MKFSYDCPACGKKVGIISLMLAMTPFIVTCRHCRSRLKATGVTLLVLISMLVIGSLLLVYTSQYVSKFGGIDLPALGVMILFIAIIELIASLIICNMAKIVVVKNRYKEK